MGFEAESERLPLTPEQESELRGVAIGRAPEALAAYQNAQSDDERFDALCDAAFAAFHLEQYELASRLAAEMLAAAPNFEGDWNYGNAVHAGHTVLGLLALRNGDTPLAVEELHKAGATCGSPQLGSFGPTMILAKALLRVGESEAVLTHFGQCRKFWKMGETWLDIWEGKVRDGQTPNFFMHQH
ncbi:hypothetical protein [Usitatibacter palustris]|uniref:Uncharacterized protein n=1 Tax=Usitatibacter palustris TaxID=2732487 RepID=A0A6M4H1W2_9PROT|nr:hypothetical protein [Usitatibacter palustris]QJR13496.1 hypothetical protein DSM104440_00280 [Usitatibacter palustris]